MPLQLFFFPFLFLAIVSVCPYVVNAVIGRYNCFLFPIINIVFVSSYWGIYAIFNSGESSIRFLDTYSLCHLSGGRPCASSTTFLTSGPFVWVFLLFILRIVPSILRARLPKCLSVWCDFCSRAWFLEVFSVVWGTLFLFFLSSLMFWWNPLPIFPSTYNFPLLFLDLAVLFFMFFVFFHFSFHSYNLAVYFYCFYQSPILFYLFIFLQTAWCCPCR